MHYCLKTPIFLQNRLFPFIVQILTREKSSLLAQEKMCEFQLDGLQGCISVKKERFCHPTVDPTTHTHRKEIWSYKHSLHRKNNIILEHDKNITFWFILSFNRGVIVKKDYNIAYFLVYMYLSCVP